MQALELPPDLRFRLEIDLPTRWSDEDNQGVLNNAVYLTLIEEARLQYFGALELMEGPHFPFVLAQSQVRFQAPGRGGERWRVAVASLRLGQSSLEQAYRLTDGGGRVVATALALLVGWDNARRQKRAFDARFRERVAAFEGWAPGATGKESN